MLEIGSSLREARSQRGLELAEVEAATNIRVRYLEALELEQFDLLPPGPYRRSFLREYAKFLGLDADIYASEYELQFPPPEPEPAPALRRRGVHWLGQIPLARSLAIFAAIAVVGLAIWRLSGSGNPGSAPLQLPPPAPKPRAQHRPTPRHATTPHTAPRRTPPLSLTATRGACWLLVRIGSSTGATIYEGTLQQNQSLHFGLRKPLWVRIGAPWNLTARIGDRRVSAFLPATTGDIVATKTGLHPSA
jgi:transcriptional regulator with XRE-family HTH domain